MCTPDATLLIYSIKTKKVGRNGRRRAQSVPTVASRAPRAPLAGPPTTRHGHLTNTAVKLGGVYRHAGHLSMSHGVQVGVSQAREDGARPPATTCSSSWLQFADHWHLSSCVPKNRSHEAWQGPAQALDLRGNEAVEGTPDCQTRRRKAIGSSRRVPRCGRRQLVRACGSETAAAMAGHSPIGVS